MEVGEGAINADIEAEVGRLGVVIVVVALDEELVAWELLKQMACGLALEEGEVAKDVDGVALIDRALPEVEQPLIVGLDVNRVGMRAIGRVLEDVRVTEMEVSREVDLVHFSK